MDILAKMSQNSSASFSLFYFGCGQRVDPPPLFTDLSVTNRVFVFDAFPNDFLKLLYSGNTLQRICVEFTENSFIVYFGGNVQM